VGIVLIFVFGTLLISLFKTDSLILGQIIVRVIFFLIIGFILGSAIGFIIDIIRNENLTYYFKGFFIGAILGALIFIQDYEFFINVVGPSTPLSDYIRNLFGVSYNNLFFPLLILIIFFGLLFAFIGWIVGKFRKE